MLMMNLSLTLPPLEAAGFLLHREPPAVAGLTLAPQAFNLSVCPTAKLRVDLFQPLETRLVFQFGQFSRELRPGDRFASLFIGLLSTRQYPVEDEPSRARITRERRLLFESRSDSELVDLSFRHLFPHSLRVEIFGNRMFGSGAGSRSKVKLWPRCSDNTEHAWIIVEAGPFATLLSLLRDWPHGATLLFAQRRMQ